jgi:hypothetical protein
MPIDRKVNTHRTPSLEEMALESLMEKDYSIELDYQYFRSMPRIVLYQDRVF